VRYANEDIYRGQWKNNQKHGKGKFSYADGDEYEGGFVNGKREGNGTYRFTDGKQYKGEFKAGKFNGIGKYQWVDGTVYEGAWKDDKRHGIGKIIGSDGSGDFAIFVSRLPFCNFFLVIVVYEGQWVDDEMMELGVPCVTCLCDFFWSVRTCTCSDICDENATAVFNTVLEMCCLPEEKRLHYDQFDLILSRADEGYIQIAFAAVLYDFYAFSKSPNSTLIVISFYTYIRE
jgi:hypothetical protein